ncbi:MAG: rhomboid family intramembrane serine protease [Chloroflexi bacterium]|nr:rhomboid family intramembrane serine protease [Chloroflexi bacterium CFX1]MCK6566261.1 rhomboid family intramembrane serine protease [Anaerolineales bacterium]MCQ3954662.1 rhomboid family intramembrane serine protease [Chloroflexota bacterium]MDL1920916.1 rhomboid family intramembrane serine protease [Chloroflexi bacterium CFX5]NUQ60701.1 rhomboid family intramembrane serine protease [Anaerolineales bacterium]
MIPLNDDQPNRYGSIPFVTISLIALNTAILFWEFSLPFDILWKVIWFFGFRPSVIWAQEGAGMLSSITAMFLHGGIAHLLGNMLFLWVFGRRVEDACGPARFLIFYLFAGVCADLITAIVQPHESIPGIGASGAIFGVMGAYLILFPEGRIRTLWFIYFIPAWPHIRAVWFIFYYLIVQIPPALDTYLNGVQYGIGYWAHLGGFSACIFILLFLRHEAFARYMSNVGV